MIEILTLVLVIITGFYAWYTYKILQVNEGVVRQMQLEHEATRRLYITISIYAPHSSTVILYLKIRNSGLMPANNLRLSMNKDFFRLGERKEENNIRLRSAFQEPIIQFVPGTEVTFCLAEASMIFAETADPNVTPTIFTITAKYEYEDKKVRENITVDLRPFFKSVVTKDPICAQLDELTEAVAKLKS